MSTPTGSSSTTDPLQDDLQFLFASSLPSIDDGPGAIQSAAIDGDEVELEAAIAHVAAVLRESVAPAIVGLGGLSVEAADSAVDLALQLRAKLLLHPTPDPVQARQGVSFHAGLGEAFAADLRVVNNLSSSTNAGNEALTLAIHERVPNALFMAIDDLDAVLRLRLALETDGVDAIRRLTTLPVNHVIVMLPPGVDPRVASQWHRLSASMQSKLRTSVITTPADADGNARGVTELIALRTGLNVQHGGVDFSTGEPQLCSGFDAHIRTGGCDVAIDTGFKPTIMPSDNMPETLRISHDASDAKRFQTWLRGGLATGIAARVMRFDGAMLWLCDDPAAAPVDPTVSLFKMIAGAL